MAAGMFAATSCSDFSDYNEVVPDATPSANLTLWENIQQNSNLSDFATLVKKSGFDEELSTSHYYTVWAPVNGSFDPTAYEQLGIDALLKQFVQNHIADYGHSASGSLAERVLMLNEKKHDFTGVGTYKFDDINVTASNLPSSNGLMHLLNGAAAYYPHLYDYITDFQLSARADIDSLRDYFLHYEHVWLDEQASVVGPIVDGLQTYIDSVMVIDNDLNAMLRAEFDNEDSTYTVLLPNNEAWNKAYRAIKAYYNYIPTTQAQNFVTTNGTTAVDDKNPAKAQIDNAYMQDSIVKRYLTRNLVYSNNDAYNLWLQGQPSAYGSDTLRSTTRTKLSNPQAILKQTLREVPMSNGVARIVDSLAMYPWETYAPEHEYSAVNERARIGTGYAHTYRVDMSTNPDVDNFSYLWAEPNGPYAKAELNVYLPDVLSTTYDIYCVFIPAWDQTDDYQRLPNRVNFELSYCDATGALKTQTFLDESEENVKWCTDYIEYVRENNPAATQAYVDNASTRTTFRGFSNDPNVIDSVYVGRFTFPVCYYGLGTGDEHICPNIKISSPFSVFNKTAMAAFTRDLRISAIVLKPVELVEFEESNKQ